MVGAPPDPAFVVLLPQNVRNPGGQPARGKDWREQVASQRIAMRRGLEIGTAFRFLVSFMRCSIRLSLEKGSDDFTRLTALSAEPALRHRDHVFVRRAPP